MNFRNAINTIAVFDLDGTLVETDAANSAAYREALRRCGYGEVVGLYGRITAEAIRAAVDGISDLEMNEIVRAKVDAYCHELWRTRLGPAADALKCVLVNRRAFEKVVLLTDSAERRAMETLRFHGLAAYFDEIVSNGGVGDKYANYFKGFDSDPAACVVWENESGMVQSAIAAGVKDGKHQKGWLIMQHGKIGSDAFLGRDVDLYFHADYYGFSSSLNTLRFVNYLKNDRRDFDAVIPECEDKAASVLAEDLKVLVQMYGPLTVCGIPRSKREDYYHPAKMGLKRAIRKAVSMVPGLSDGVDYIVRHTNTLCTHRSYWGYGGDGEGPRPGLLKDTCTVSKEVVGKNIVLVDDIYTAGVGIDEDGVQALLNAGAKSVIMYTFGCTASRGYRKCA